MLQSLSHYEKISSRSHSNYLAQISIETAQTNNEINDVLSKLTALGSVLIPMNLVTGLWGMNVQVPGQFQVSKTVETVSLSLIHVPTPIHRRISLGSFVSWPLSFPFVFYQY
jgi:Mg2+ and Co2+ transporter CorA